MKMHSNTLHYIVGSSKQHNGGVSVWSKHQHCTVCLREQHNGPNTKAERWTLTWRLCLYHMTFCLYHITVSVPYDILSVLTIPTLHGTWFHHYTSCFTIYDIDNRYIEGLTCIYGIRCSYKANVFKSSANSSKAQYHDFLSLRLLGSGSTLSLKC